MLTLAVSIQAFIAWTLVLHNSAWLCFADRVPWSYVQQAGKVNRLFHCS
jgi:hypothetical protein